MIAGGTSGMTASDDSSMPCAATPLEFATALDGVFELAVRSLDAAHARLRSIIAANSRFGPLNYSWTNALVTTAFSIVDLRSVELAVTLHFANIIHCAVEIAPGDPPHGELIRWEIAPGGRHRFTFNSGLFRGPTEYVYAVTTRWVALLRIINRCAQALPPAGSCVLDVGDVCSSDGLNFCDNRVDSLLIPDALFASTHGYIDSLPWFAPENNPWAERLPLAIWRGSSTGNGHATLLDTPRVRLCRLGASQPDLIDAGISDVVQAPTPEDAAHLHDSGLVKPRISMEEHARYKYQIDIDGNSNSWPGLFQKLLTGSPVLKVLSPTGHRQWYYARLRPWENFIPVRSDLSDLIDLVRYLREHDELARSIGEAGRRLALEMTFEAEVDACAATLAAAFRRSAFTDCRSRAAAG